ncbi:hypothetical protein Poli38472_002439 [Pythium oligandrum]|uniref:Vacuolar protein sorting 55 n=1 Tax=Pythium oligandrum TaxID=41045 RepID=A0A8K1CIB7_PYTOL|nr:hypothetical protein Poli38472_002439 [Pythium oligandrum]|eukprot:TMW63498.1 hypothetical protein Poli38472_002439 [Pythium oligandrum]
MKRSLQLGIFGSLLVVALVCVILSAALYPTQWGLFVLLPYILLPITAAGCAALGDDDELSIWSNFGCFFEAFFWVSTVAVPSILYRVEAINGSQLGWLLASDVLVFASFVGLAWVNANS